MPTKDAVIHAWVMAALLMPPQFHGSELSGEMPEAFRGRWETQFADCREPYNAGTLWVGKNDIEMWESAGDIVAAVTGPEGDVVVVAELSGEGETWLWSEHYALTDDGRLSIVGLPNAQPKLRCPDAMDGRPEP